MRGDIVPPQGLGGCPPRLGGSGATPLKQKNQVVFGPLYYSSSFGTSSFEGWKTLYICIMAVYFVSSYVVQDPCIGETDRE